MHACLWAEVARIFGLLHCLSVKAGVDQRFLPKDLSRDGAHRTPASQLLAVTMMVESVGSRCGRAETVWLTSAFV
jgi:hypothetical protein